MILRFCTYVFPKFSWNKKLLKMRCKSKRHFRLHLMFPWEFPFDGRIGGMWRTKISILANCCSMIWFCYFPYNNLSEKILLGDENAARLMGTPLNDIYPLKNSSNNIPQKTIPTQIRLKYYLYQFKDDKRSFLSNIFKKSQNILDR